MGFKAETVEWSGRKYRRYPDSPERSDCVYFKCSYAAKNPTYLHRDVWSSAHGDIPSGHHIHHIDEDTSNNSVDNLRCLTPAEHSAQHPYDDERLERVRVNLDAIRHLSKAWHASPEGIEAHRRAGAMAYDKFVSIPKPCERCNKEFSPAANGNRDRFCSNACKSAHRRDSGVDDVQRSCVFCSKPFAANRYARTQTCGRSCANRERHRQKREGV